MQTLKERAQHVMRKGSIEDYENFVQEIANAPTPEPFGYFKAEPFGWTDCAETDDGAIALFAAPPTPSVPELEEYDAGFLNDFGGGNVGWWQDYIRAELGIAYEFYCSQLSAAQTPAEPPTDVARDVRLQVESEFAAPQPEPLSDERIDEICDCVERSNVLFSQSWIYALARAIEREILGGEA